MLRPVSSKKRNLVRSVTRLGNLGRIAALFLLISLALLRMVDPSGLEVLRLKTFDLYQTIAAPPQRPGQILIVDIDEKSLGKLGQWPWPRTLVADLVKAIAAKGAVAMATDILFPEYDRLSPGAIADTVRRADPEVADRLKALPSNDETLATAMASTRVILGQAVYHVMNQQDRPDSARQIGIATLGPPPDDFLENYPGLVRNIPELEKAAAGIGIVSVRPDIDGVIRRVPLALKADGMILPGLGLELIRVATGQSTILIRSDDAGVASLVVAGVQIPADESAHAWLHFRPHDPSIYVSASDVLDGSLPANIFQDKLVLIGASATGLFDLKATPVDPAMPGVEIHAQIIAGILGGSLLQRPNWATAAEIVLTIVLGFLMILLVPRLGAIRTLATGATVAFAVTAFSWWLFVDKSLVLDFAFPLLATLLVTSVMIVAAYLNEEVERRQIRAAFGQYLSPELVNQLAANPEKLVLGGETRLMSVLFSDVRGFTALSETYKGNPQALTNLINRLLTPMSAEVIKHRGTIDKYMGDNIMAFWNAPIADGEHAVNACSAALDILKALEKLNVERRDEIGPDGDVVKPLKVGVGINTGQCVVGNMGSEFRFDYTVLGDSVNLASRLEGQTKAYGVKIIIGEETAHRAAEKCAILPIDKIRVVGKKEPEEIFTLLGGIDCLNSPGFVQLRKTQMKLLAAYRAMRWKEFDDCIEECRKLAAEFGLEPLYDVYASRSKLLQRFAPPKDWDGVFDALGK